MIGYNSTDGCHILEPFLDSRQMAQMRRTKKYRGAGCAGHAKRAAYTVVRLPSGKFGLARITFMAFGGGRQQSIIPGEYATEADAEKAARALEPRAIARMKRQDGEAPGTWKEIDDATDQDEEAEG